MAVIIANFGQENFFWPKCLSNSTIALMEEKQSHALIQGGDKQGYINYVIKNLKTADGKPPTERTAATWYGFNQLFYKTVDDLWIHRAKDELYWTYSIAGEVTQHEQNDPYRKWDLVISQRPCTGWQNKDRKGRALLWDEIHPKATGLLFARRTFMKLCEDNAQYALALIEGNDEILGSYHARDEWVQKQTNAGRGSAHLGSPKEKTIKRMVGTALRTCESANGQIVERTMKEKGFMFDSPEEMIKHVSCLWDEQDGKCALTGLKMLPDGQDRGGWYSFSLDRIDSNDDYRAGNLQLVCKFANKWKSDMENETFLKLIEDVRKN